MKKISSLTLLLVLHFQLFSQNEERTFKCDKIYDAIKLMDEGKFEESIKILKKCEKIDKDDYAYPYEIALAYTYLKKYDKAIEVLNRIKNYKNLQADYYQLLGNNYDMNKQTNEAIQVYNQGLKLFPDAGALYLEKGIIYEFQMKYDLAIETFENGIKVDPMYPSNYFRLAKLYLQSNNKLSGLIYGEIFMNLERTTKRTTEISKLMFECYKSSIQFNGNETKLDLCEITLIINDIEDEIKMPLCAVYANSLILSLIQIKEINLKTLSEIRTDFIVKFFKEDFKKYPNVLFEYHKLMFDNEHFDAYNRYLFQMGAADEFSTWQNENKEVYDKFVTWYTDPQNLLQINKENKFISN